MTTITYVTPWEMGRRTGQRSELGFAFGDSGEILVRKGLPEKTRKRVLDHEREHIRKGETGGFSWGSLIGGVVGGLLGGGGSKKQTVTQTSQEAPWIGQQPYLTRGFGEAERLLNQGPMQYYPGQTYAPFTPAQTTGQNMALQFANQLPGQIAPVTGAQRFLMGDVLRPESNPYLQQYASAAIRPIQETYSDVVMPSITREAVGTGGFGGDRQGIAEGLASRELLRKTGDVTAGIYSQAYGQGLDAMTRGLALAPQTLSLGAVPADIYRSIGGEQQAQQQRAYDEALSRWNFNQQAPWDALSQYMAAVRGSYGGTSVANTPYFTNPWMNVLGGALTGSQIGGLFGGGDTISKALDVSGWFG